jgi:ABC-type transporter Mla subunit MlaD
MKLITKYKLFLEALNINDDEPEVLKNAKETLNTFEEDLKEFNSKKQQLATLIENSDGKDIEKDIENIIGKGDERNELLSKYLTILTLRKNILQQQGRLEYFTKMKQQRRENISDINKLSDPEEKKQQMDSLNQQIADLDEKYKSMDNSLKENEKELKDKEKELDDYIKDSKKEMDDALKELEK